MNNTQQIGRLTKDLELKKTEAGKSYVHFSIAVNRKFKNAKGDYEADFIPCTLWGAQAETLAKYASKGNRIAIDGELRTRTYQDASGARRFSMEILVNNFEFLESKASQTATGSTQGPAPVQASQPTTQELFGGAPMDIDPNDLPF
jgi:single-strand DNA-binding protein